MHTFVEAAHLDPAQAGGEAARLAQSPGRLAPGFVVSAEYEEAFYTGNNLPEQLRTLFSPINPRRVDEDALEVLCERAVERVRGSFLLDDAVQQFYRALSGTGLTAGPLHLRRDGAVQAWEAQLTPPGSEALFALKRLWAQDWTFDAVLERLDDNGSIALEARPVLVFAGRPGKPDAGLAAQLGWPRALINERGVVGA